MEYSQQNSNNKATRYSLDDNSIRKLINKLNKSHKLAKRSNTEWRMI